VRNQMETAELVNNTILGSVDLSLVQLQLG